MEKYNYRESICNDIRRWLKEEGEEFKSEFADENGVWLTEENKDDVDMKLFDILWEDDTVTGGLSGSYTRDRYLAEEYLCHNMDLLAEAINEFYDDFSCHGETMGEIIKLMKNPELQDDSIRKYLLGECISEVIDEILKK